MGPSSAWPFIGLAFTLPFFWFLARGKLAIGHRWKFFGVALLIGLQGAIGWWMVHSGLQEGMVSVSQYRLATHLGMAFIILGVLYWLFKRQRSRAGSRAAFKFGRGRALLLAGSCLSANYRRRFYGGHACRAFLQ